MAIHQNGLSALDCKEQGDHEGMMNYLNRMEASSQEVVQLLSTLGDDLSHAAHQDKSIEQQEAS